MHDYRRDLHMATLVGAAPLLVGARRRRPRASRCGVVELYAADS